MSEKLTITQPCAIENMPDAIYHADSPNFTKFLNYRGQQGGVPVLPPTPGSPLVEPQEMTQGTLPLWGQEAA